MTTDKTRTVRIMEQYRVLKEFCANLKLTTHMTFIVHENLFAIYVNKGEKIIYKSLHEDLEQAISKALDNRATIKHLAK